MRTQEHNTGELSELKVEIEAQLCKDLKLMEENSGINQAELVAIAIKRFRSCHADYMGVKVDFP
jgi:hypothetical protein